MLTNMLGLQQSHLVAAGGTTLPLHDRLFAVSLVALRSYAQPLLVLHLPYPTDDHRIRYLHDDELVWSKILFLLPDDLRVCLEWNAIRMDVELDPSSTCETSRYTSHHERFGQFDVDLDAVHVQNTGCATLPPCIRMYLCSAGRCGYPCRCDSTIPAETEQGA